MDTQLKKLLDEGHFVNFYWQGHCGGGVVVCQATIGLGLGIVNQRSWFGRGATAAEACRDVWMARYAPALRKQEVSWWRRFWRRRSPPSQLGEGIGAQLPQAAIHWQLRGGRYVCAVVRNQLRFQGEGATLEGALKVATEAASLAR